MAAAPLWRCLYCRGGMLEPISTNRRLGKKARREMTEHNLLSQTKDHVRPQSYQGANTNRSSNIVLVHGRCNTLKAEIEHLAETEEDRDLLVGLFRAFVERRRSDGKAWRKP